MRYATIALLVLVGAMGAAMPMAGHAQDRIEIAQQKKETLWDMLFGPSDKKKKSSASSRPKILKLSYQSS